MNLQGTHRDTGQGRDAFIYKEKNKSVCVREKEKGGGVERGGGGLPTTVKLIRTSCLSLPPLYL